jgi:F0F1-type ATP synthase membrane subunit b/b'
LKTLESEKAKMVSEAKREVAELVISATEKIIGSKVDNAYNEKVVKELNNL